MASALGPYGICARTVEIERRLTRTAPGSADLSRSGERGVDPLDELVDVAGGVYVVRQPRAVEMDRERLARPERHDHCLPLTLEAELRAARRNRIRNRGSRVACSRASRRSSHPGASP